MKILHTADIHIGEFPGPERGGINCRLQDTLDCMKFLADTAAEEQPDVIVIAGDLFHRSKLWADEMLFEVQAAMDWITSLAAVAPVCLLYGTPNHDNLEAFYTLRKALPETVHIFTEPGMKMIKTKSGIIQVCGLPGFDRGYYRAQNPGISREEENQAFTNSLSESALALKAMCNPKYPSILMAHYTVPGANTESGQTQLYSQAEPLLLPEVLDAARFDLVTLGHIHRPQKLTTAANAFYCGGINAFNFGDEGQDRGFWIHDLAGNSRFVTTPYRRFATLWLKEADVAAINLGEMDAVADSLWGAGEVINAVVRVLYACTDQTDKAFNKALLERRLYAEGAFWVQEITPEQITVVANKQGLSEHSTPEDNLRDYLMEKAIPDAQIEKIVEAARPIIAEATANSLSAQFSGVFEPVEVQVKNYRNYAEAAFDFEDVRMCTINGSNGAGKSSLFMDAITDCLFEEPREGDLTGWIRNDESARSGAITFTFRIGSHTFRVSRTRAKSGKATLNLAEMVEDEWVSRAKERMADTQAEIINVLGMDSLTFRSCALIMQDQYGLFLEAGKEARMETIGNLLGLGIYGAMEDAARDRSTDVNREIRVNNANVERLSADLPDEGEIVTAIATQKQEIAAAEAAQATLTQAADNIKLRLATKQEAADRAQKLQDTITTLQGKRRLLELNQEQQRQIITNADDVLSREADIMQGVAEYNALIEQEKQYLTAKGTYDTKSAQVGQLYSEVQRLVSEQASLRTELTEVENRKLSLAIKLSTAQAYASKAAQYQSEKAKLVDMEAAGTSYLALHNQRADLLREKARLDSAFQAEEARRTAEYGNLKSKAALLESSNCIDPSNARCAFLKDAREAQAQIVPFKEECIAWRQGALSSIAAVDAKIRDMDAEQEALGFDPDALTGQRERVRELEQADKEFARSAGYQEQITMLDERIQSLQGSIESITAAEVEAIKRHDDAAQELIQLKDDADKCVSIQLQIAKAKSWVDREKLLPVARERKKVASERLAELEAEVFSVDAEVLAASESLQDEQKTAEGGAVLQLELDEINQQVREHGRRITDAHTLIGSYKRQLEQSQIARQEIEKLQAQALELSEKAAIYEELKKAFSQDGVPHNIIRSIIPMLTATANNILSQMTGGKMGLEFVTERIVKSNKNKEVTTLDIIIEEYGKNRLPYLSKSGGEKVKAALAAILALSEIKSSRAGIQLGMLFIDEPPFLDAAGMQAYCDALETIRLRYPSLKVMAITHDPSMKARFPQSLDVIKTEVGSQIVIN